MSVTSACFYPTTIFSVDDNQQFFKVIKIAVDPKQAICRFTDDPQKALQFLKKEYHPDVFTTRCVVTPEDQSIDKVNIEINIKAIQQEIYNNKRYAEITVVILDYAMPGLNGGKLAEQLKGLPFKIILLTGEADTKVAVELFNQNVIHSYIRKDDPHFKNVLKAVVANLQHEYFAEASHIIINSMAQNPDYHRAWFKDPAFKKLFQKICDENKIVEYYLLDEQGSYQLLDAKGHVSFLAFADEEMMETYAILAKDDHASNTIVADLESLKQIPFFYSSDDFNVRPSEWGKYLHPAQLLKGEQNYYYSYITDIKNYKVDTKKIVSYEQFLKAQEKHN